MMTSATVNLFITCAGGAAAIQSGMLEFKWGDGGVCRTAVQHGVSVPTLNYKVSCKGMALWSMKARQVEVAFLRKGKLVWGIRA